MKESFGKVGGMVGNSLCRKSECTPCRVEETTIEGVSNLVNT